MWYSKMAKQIKHVDTCLIWTKLISSLSSEMVVNSKQSAQKAKDFSRIERLPGLKKNLLILLLNHQSGTAAALL